MTGAATCDISYLPGYNWRANLLLSTGGPMSESKKDRRNKAEKTGHPVSPETTSTLTLLDRARRGDDEALAILCGRYLPRLRRWAGGRLPGYARGMLDTDDLVQETLLRTIRQVDNMHSRREGAFQVYVRQVLLNRIRDEARRPKRVLPLTGDGPEPVDLSASPLETLIGKGTLERYEKALEKLSDADREAVVARIEFGGTYRELAEILGKPSADAARMAVARAMIRLAEEMGDER